jgi:hypothetical protein
MKKRLKVGDTVRVQKQRFDVVSCEHVSYGPILQGKIREIRTLLSIDGPEPLFYIHVKKGQVPWLRRRSEILD